MSIANDKLVNLQDAQVLYNDLRGRINDKIDTSAKGVANGIAELDSTGKVPSSQLPSYVDDVEEYDAKDFSAWNEWVGGTAYAVGDRAKITDNGTVIGYICNTANSSATFDPTEWDVATKFPTTGESGKVYVADDTNITYRWAGSSYVAIGSDLAIGETESTAYRGDRGKAAYDASVVNPDASPTQNSTNLVKSGGVYSAIEANNRVLVYESSSSFPVTGSSGKIYMALDEPDAIYAWDSTNSEYTSISGNSGESAVKPVTFNIATTDWTTVTGGYAATVTDTTINSDSIEFVKYSDTAIANLRGVILLDKNATNHQAIFKVKTVPAGAVTGTLYVVSPAGIQLDTKADRVQNATNGNFAALDSQGNLVDSGHKHGDYVVKQQGSHYAGKVLGINSSGAVEPVAFSGDDFTGATASTDGTHGYVPAPEAGEQSLVLMGNGNWEMPPNARLDSVTMTVTNTSGAYSGTVSSDAITPYSAPVRIEISNPSAFGANISVTPGDGQFTVACSDVSGTSTLKIEFLKQVQTSEQITSAEFDILNNRLMAVENVYTDTDISIAVADWTLANGVYSYTWTSTAVTTLCGVEVFLRDGAENAGIGDFDYSKVTGGVQFTTNETPVGALPLTIRIINCKATDIDDLKGTYDIPFTIQASAWSENSPYTYTWLSEYVTSDSGVEVVFYSGNDNTEISSLDYERVSGGIQFTSAVKPTTNITVCAHIDNTLTYNYTAIAANMVSTNAVSGAVNAEEALSALDNKITTQVVSAFNGNNQTWKGQSYNDIFSLSAGKWLVICDYSGDFAGIICKNNSIYGANLFGDISRGGVAYVNINATTTIQIYINTNDTSNYTAYRAIFKAIKLFD